MSEKNPQPLQLSFLQLMILLILQVSLLGGSFYLGTRWGSREVSGPYVSREGIQDQDLARLLPAAAEGARPVEAAISNLQNSESPTSRPSSTPFDRSSSTVFRIKSSSNSEYSVQIASYPDEAAAIRVVDEWKRKGYMAFLSVEEVPDRGKWYRINLGNFGDEKSAQDYARTIEEKEHVTPQVVLSE